MDLKEIKNKIESAFKKLTIDDFYHEIYTDVAKNIFFEETKLSTEEEIESYLEDKFQEILGQGKYKSLKKKAESKHSSENEESNEDTEYKSLEFLYKTLLQMEIRREEIYEDVKFLEKVDGDPLQNFMSRIETKSEKTGEFSLNKTQTNMFIEDDDFVTSYAISSDVIPSNWRLIIGNVLSKPIPNLSGVLNRSIISRYSLELNALDTSTLLALKIAIKTNESIETENNKIVLGLPGGLAAHLTFRKKGNLVANTQKKSTELFSLSHFRYGLYTLYHQNGYANSEIKIESSIGYYMLTDNYSIEISFSAAPILFNNNNVMQYAPNISAKAKHEDEIAEEEEEERRKNDEEDY